ncbi:hypothetical protein [Actinomadura napierensis]|uniref:Uncharacterized protein n=1 Tax=Actinomadura napierensis TaxID=267854 RepID=A0ABN3A2N8_9ACTN
MITYAFDEDRHAIVAVRETGSNCSASTFAELPRDIPAAPISHLAQALPQLSAQVWRAYIIERAELGNLTDRARQALALMRADASPVQVQAADKILNANPFGNPSLFTEIEPAAAAIAAAH